MIEVSPRISRSRLLRAVRLSLAAIPAALSCGHKEVSWPVAEEATHVLVVAARQDADSVTLAAYYARRRGVPPESLLYVDCPNRDHISEQDFHATILDPIRRKLASERFAIDYIVLCRGIPLRFHPGLGYGIDAAIAADELPNWSPIPESPREITPRDVQLAANPYFGKREPFSHARFGMRLVCRLDGYTLQDAEALVDHSLDARTASGPFLFDPDESRAGNPGYADMDHMLYVAGKAVKALGKTVLVSDPHGFAAPNAPLAGYVSWGSNDHSYDPAAYHRLRFVPGAIAETFVSFGARTFRPTSGGQSLIADLIHQGVTGVKGYTSEPFSFSLCRPQILFDRYLAGFNLAESFYMSSPVVRYKDIVVGDPLCRPYARRTPSSPNVRGTFEPKRRP